MDLDQRQVITVNDEAARERTTFAYIGFPFVALTVFVAVLAPLARPDFTSTDEYVMTMARIICMFIIVGFFMISTSGRVLPRLLAASGLYGASYIISLVAAQMSGTAQFFTCLIAGAILAGAFFETHQRFNP